LLVTVLQEFLGHRQCSDALLEVGVGAVSCQKAGVVGDDGIRWLGQLGLDEVGEVVQKALSVMSVKECVLCAV
jgi:hypothetical protein